MRKELLSVIIKIFRCTFKSVSGTTRGTQGYAGRAEVPYRG